MSQELPSKKIRRHDTETYNICHYSNKDGDSELFRKVLIIIDRLFWDGDIINANISVTMVYFKTFMENYDQFSLIFDYIIIVSPENEYDKNDFDNTIQKLNEISKTTEISLYYVYIDGTKSFYEDTGISKKAVCLKAMNLSVVEKIITSSEDDSGNDTYNSELSKIYDQCSSFNRQETNSSHEITSSLSNDSFSSSIKNQNNSISCEKVLHENPGDKRFVTSSTFDQNRNKGYTISSNKQYNIPSSNGSIQNQSVAYNKNMVSEWFIENKHGNMNEPVKAYDQNGKSEFKSTNNLNYMNLETKNPYVINTKTTFSSSFDKNKHCKYERERRERIKDCCNILRKIIPRDDRIKTKKDMASVLENTVQFLHFIQMNIPESVQLSLNKMYIEHTLLTSCKMGEEVKKQEHVKKDISNEPKGVNLLKLNDHLMKSNNLYVQNRITHNEPNKENKINTFMKNHNPRNPFVHQHMNHQHFYGQNYRIPSEMNIKDQNDFFFNANNMNMYNRNMADIIDNQNRIFDNFARHENNAQLNLLLSNVINNEASLNKEWNNNQLDKNIQQTR